MTKLRYSSSRGAIDYGFVSRYLQEGEGNHILEQNVIEFQDLDDENDERFEEIRNGVEDLDDDEDLPELEDLL